MTYFKMSTWHLPEENHKKPMTIQSISLAVAAAAVVGELVKQMYTKGHHTKVYVKF